MKDPIFIVGMPRSGSTFLLNIIVRNENILRVGEVHLLNPWRKDFRFFVRKNIDNLSNVENVKKMVDLIFSKRVIPGLTGVFWHKDLARIDTPELKKKIIDQIYESDKTIESIFKIIIENFLLFRNFNQCCIKFPTYVNHVPDLIKWFPNCKIIHLIRDPRATFISKTNDPDGSIQKFRKYNIFNYFLKKLLAIHTVVQYVWTSILHNKYQKYDNYSLYMYEDILVEKERLIRDICNFANIDFVPTMLQPKEGQISSLTGKQSHGVDEKAGIRWVDTIARFDYRLITFLTKKSMKRFGFDPNIHLIYQNINNPH